MGEPKTAYRILVRKPEEEDQHVGGWTILKWILEGWDGSIWLRIGMNLRVP
jgi:hypothetical protein